VAILLLAACGMVPAPGGAQTPLSVSPSTVAVGRLLAGSRLRIAGHMRYGSDVVVVVRGRDVREIFNRKARFGPLWIAGGKVEVSGVPATFLAFSQKPIATLLPRAIIDEFVLDERALVMHMQIAPPEADRQEIRDSFLRLKVDEGTYRSATHEYTLEAPIDGQVPYALELEWPATAPPGPYRVLACECRDQAVVGTSAGSFDVVESGFAGSMKHLADDHGAMYGVLAVGITLSLGFGLDQGLAWARRRRNARRRRRSEALVRGD
jgi:hypothetical protein